MKLFFQTLFILGLVLTTAANSGKKDKHHGIDDHELRIKVKQGKKLLAGHSYYNAAKILKEVADSLPDNEYVNYLTGSIYFKARDYKNAEI